MQAQTSAKPKASGPKAFVASCALLASIAACSKDASSRGRLVPKGESQPLSGPSRSVVPPMGDELSTPPTIDGLVDSIIDGAVQYGPALNAVPGSDLNAWRSAAADPSLSPPALADQLGTALAVVGGNPGIDFGKTELDIGKVSVPSTSKVDVTYLPERARWMRLGDAPEAMEEIRQRGARLYCSAKDAYLQGGGASRIMGQKSLAHFTVLGKRIDIFKTEPTVALRGPRRFLGSPDDGAQAFVIPMTVGTRFTPITPLSLPELRTSVDFVTADAAIVNHVDSWNADMETVTHADAFSAVKVSQSTDIASQSLLEFGKDDPLKILLFTLGPISVQLGLSLDTQTAICSRADSLASCDDTPQQQAFRLLSTSDDRYPQARSGGNTGGQWGLFDDGPWFLDTGLNPFINGAALRIAYPQPLGVRMAQDNDKSLEVRTGFTLKASLGAVLGIAVEGLPFEIEAEAKGELGATTAVVHAIREQLNIAGSDPEVYAGMTDLSVTPHMELDLGLDFVVEITFKLHLPVLGEVGFKVTPLKQSIASTSHAFPAWNEDHRLRIGTALANSSGSIDTSPAVSHWPGGDLFSTPSQSLDDCLNEYSAPGDSPASQELEAPCDALPASDDELAQAAAPHGELCFVQPDAILDANNCDANLWGFANRKTIRTIGDGTTNSLVRIVPMDPNDPDMVSTWQELEQALGACDRGNADDIQAILDTHIFACDSDGQPYGPDEAVQATVDDGDGEADLPTRSCH